MACVVMAYIVMAHVLKAYLMMAYEVMACVGMAYVGAVIAVTGRSCHGVYSYGLCSYGPMWAWCVPTCPAVAGSGGGGGGQGGGTISADRLRTTPPTLARRGGVAGSMPERGQNGPSADLLSFLSSGACRRRTPRGCGGSEGRAPELWASILRYLQLGRGRRQAPT